MSSKRKFYQTDLKTQNFYGGGLHVADTLILA